MAHELHAKGHSFRLHYSGRTRASMGFLEDLVNVPWKDNIRLHISDDGTRLDLPTALRGYKPGWHVYTCGAERYMAAVMEAAEAAGFPEEARHLEYFSVPDQPDYVNHPFRVKLARSGKTFDVPADRSAADILVENGMPIDLKCSDGLCGVCKCALVSGDVEHRDFVLSKSQRDSSVILCQSRAAEAGGIVEIDL